MPLHRLPRLALVFAGAAALVLSSLRADSVDDTVNALMAKRHIPGLSLAVIDGGKIVKAQGYGVIEVGKPEPVTVDTLFQAGSVSKSVSALGVLSLVEAGKLSLEADVNGALKSWHVPENEFTKDSKVTLRRLLSHSAGLTVHGFPGYPVDAPVPSLVQVLDGTKPIANTPPIRVDVVPGSIFRYSGGGYTVMQQLVIDVSGQTFPDFMRQAVLTPLGMTASGYEQPLAPARAALTATGYYATRQAVPGRWHVYPEMAAAGLWTTPSDLARFVIGVQETLAGRAHPVISAPLAKKMTTKQKDDDGLGVFIEGAEGQAQRFWHNGRDEGFDAMMKGYLTTGQGAVIMLNVNDDSNSTARILTAIADAYHWPDYPHPVPAKAIEDKEPAVTAQIRGSFEDAAQGIVKPELYTPKLGALIADAIAHGGNAQIKAFGPLQKVELLRRSESKGARNYRYRFIYENETVLVNCTYDAEGKIAGLSFRPE